MGNFYLVDQSMKGPGGHHFDYTNLLSQAAANANWSVIVGCHRKFQSSLAAPGCKIRNCFRNTTYANCSSLVGIQDMVSRRKDSLLAHLMGRLGFSSAGGRKDVHQSIRSNPSRLQKIQSQRIDAFREDLHTFFRRPLTRDDVVFLTTLSDLEAEGLYQFMRERSDAKLANWHLQFHFPIFRGRTPEYDGQAEHAEAISRTLRKLDTLSQTNIRYYVTSDNLRDQYLRTGFEFQELAYPVNPGLYCEGKTGDLTPEECRLTFAGAIRDEKGGGEIERMIHELRHQIDKPVRFCVQKKRLKFWSRVKNYFSNRSTGTPQIETYPYPLSNDDYHAYIKSSHMGLLTTYNSETYFPRRAGILGEYLCAGVPVVVPAGSWLSDQLEVKQKQYLRDTLSNHRVVAVRPKSVVHHSSGKSTISFDSLSNKGEDSWDKVGLSVLRFDVVEPREHGNYFQIQVLDKNGNPLSNEQVIVGNERSSALDNRPTNQLAAFHLQPHDGEIQFEISPAYHSSGWQIENPGLSHVISDAPLPRGTVGLVAANQEQTVELVNELTTHYSHYRQTAAEFSTEWFARHDPALTFQTLINNSDLSKSKTGQAA